MKKMLSLWGLLALSNICAAFPTPNDALKRAEKADSDDAFVYTWATPEAAKRAETADSDDAFVYTWATPEAEKRAETADSDDAFVYTWATPEKRAQA
ncbi:hypothetical protein MMC15_001389 [Xylographa vitiligo]|nr:hypothetical protein [Xylographa vitiligo]